MPLSSSTSRRALRHTRAIAVQGYLREDGLWELDARITDTKPHTLDLQRSRLSAGQPLHDLWLRVTFDDNFDVVEAESVSDAVPYPGQCEAINPDYRKLVGLNLRRGFRRGLQDRLSGVDGCTHLTELAQLMPTIAIQTLAHAPERQNVVRPPDVRPFQIDGCHALRVDGAVVAEYYPRWSAAAGQDAASDKP